MTKAKTIWVLNGPNLNLLGRREPEIYGATTLDDIGEMVNACASKHGLEAQCFQSNHEGELVDLIQQANDETAGLIVNLGAYTHTSVALHDALRSYDGLVIEVHLSNLAKREEFRHHSYITPVATGLIAGLGATGYELAVEALAKALQH
ncbi:MAG: type II 3-dehydroquinate dehydratase [Alphaproteobacteria bacterium]